MKTKTYKLLVLSDLKDSMTTTLKSAISLAKMINGDIAFFHVRNPSELIDKENQLSAIRSINQEHIKTDNKIRNIIKSYSQDYGINISYSFAFGNIKNEISEYIKEHRADIVVLGKKKSNTLSLRRDNITQFVIKEHDGAIIIVDDKNALQPDKELSLGVLNGMQNTFNMDFADDLIRHNQKPLKSFKIVKNSNELKTTNAPLDKETVEYIFEQGDNSIKNISNYLSKNNINLLCVDRLKDNTSKSQENSTITPNIKDIMSNLNVSLLIVGKPKYTLQ